MQVGAAPAVLATSRSVLQGQGQAALLWAAAPLVRTPAGACPSSIIFVSCFVVQGPPSC